MSDRTHAPRSAFSPQSGVEAKTACSIDELLKCQEEINRKIIIMSSLISKHLYLCSFHRPLSYVSMKCNPKTTSFTSTILPKKYLRT